jgi:hypothetical protein
VITASSVAVADLKGQGNWMDPLPCLLTFYFLNVMSVTKNKKDLDEMVVEFAANHRLPASLTINKGK